MGKRMCDISLEDINNAFTHRIVNEGNNRDVIYIEDIPFKNVHVSLDDYARSLGAIPFEEFMNNMSERIRNYKREKEELKKKDEK